MEDRRWNGPFTQLHDREGLLRACLRAARLGYDGKWAIHPTQISVINVAFTPSDDQLRRAREIRAACGRATVEGRGAAVLGDEMIDEATRRWAEATIAKAEK